MLIPAMAKTHCAARRTCAAGSVAEPGSGLEFLAGGDGTHLGAVEANGQVFPPSAPLRPADLQPRRFSGPQGIPLRRHDSCSLSRAGSSPVPAQPARLLDLLLQPCKRLPIRLSIGW